MARNCSDKTKLKKLQDKYQKDHEEVIEVVGYFAEGWEEERGGWLVGWIVGVSFDRWLIARLVLLARLGIIAWFVLSACKFS